MEIILIILNDLKQVLSDLLSDIDGGKGCAIYIIYEREKKGVSIQTLLKYSFLVFEN